MLGESNLSPICPIVAKTSGRIKDNMYDRHVQAAHARLSVPALREQVLDIDYTLFDHRSPAERPDELMRPYLHEFLAASYSMYDIIIWSATDMKWVEVKMKELNVLSNPNYKIMCMLDHGSMITVNSEKYGYGSHIEPLSVLRS
eukprot:7306602-Pyramimonas_sp.AAC.1